MVPAPVHVYSERESWLCCQSENVMCDAYVKLLHHLFFFVKHAMNSWSCKIHVCVW